MMETSEAGRLFIISAPSGTGKSTVINFILKHGGNIFLSISATTREPRRGEVEGVSYYFVSREEFMGMIRRDEFLEYAEYIGEYYGTPKAPIRGYIERGKDVLLEIEIQGAKQVMEKEPRAVSIFIVPPSMDELEKRLRGRGTDSEEKLAARLRQAATEIEEKEHYDHIVVNNDVAETAGEIVAIINSYGTNTKT